MTKPLALLALTLACAIPAFAQSSEFGIIVGGSSRTADEAIKADGAFLNDEFSLSNSSVDLFYAVQIEPSTYFKVKAGRIETPVAVDVTPEAPGSADTPDRVRRDVPGEVQHVEGNVEYRFSEPFGSTALFAGLGFYRHSGEGIETSTNYGFNVGANGDFPLTRRYGLLVEATYHWTRADFRPRYLTVGAGLRVSF